MEREEGARVDAFVGVSEGPGEGAGEPPGLPGEGGQERPGGACTGLWLPSESLPWELGGVGGMWRASRPVGGARGTEREGAR